MTSTGMGGPGTGSFGTGGSDAGSTGSTKEEAKAQASNLAGSAREEASSVAEDAKVQARNVMDDARVMVTDQTRTQRDRFVETARSFSGDLEQMAQSGPDGMAGDVARQVAEKVRSLSERLDGREPNDILDDVRGFARRRPGMFLLGALGAGVVFGRLARGAKDAQSDSSDEGPGTRSYMDTGAGTVTATSPAYDAGLPGAGVPPGGPDPRATGTGVPGQGSGSMPYGEPLAPDELSDTPMGDDTERRML